MPSERPNLLLITTDQQRFDALSASGNGSIFTPHLNWLWRTGTPFKNGYSDCPICMPARATIMTGRHGYNQGLTGNTNKAVIDSQLSLPGLLTKAGYQTRAVGKMHFHPPRGHYGFEHMEILQDYYRWMEREHRPEIPMDHGLGQNEMEPGFATVPESLSLTHWTVDRSIDFLETRDESRPFFLWTSFSKPHPPFDPVKSYWDLYDGVSFPEPFQGEWSAAPDAMPKDLFLPTFLLNDADRFSPDQLRATRRAYYALVTQIDYNLGLLFARMRELDLMENTLIVFTSDHGEMLGDHHMGGKTVFLEGSAHVPLIVRAPEALGYGLKPGEPTEAIGCLADLTPTFARAAGVALPEAGRYDGIDLVEAARGGARREGLAGTCAGQFHMYLSEGYKYHFSVYGGAELLFDLSTDPREERNLADDPGHASRKTAMRRALIEALQEAPGDYVRGGDLATKPAIVDEDGLRAAYGDFGKANGGKWPGFHTRREPIDVTH